MRRVLIAGMSSACLALGLLPNAFAAGQPCPSASHNPGGSQSCGKGHHGGGGGNQGGGNKGGNGGGNQGGNGGKCPGNSKNPGGSPPCGKDHHGGGGGNGGGGNAACGPADQGGTAATGIVTGPVYGVGKGISGAGGAPLGDPVQTIACALNQGLGI
jgi:hypothetical protein